MELKKRVYKNEQRKKRTSSGGVGVKGKHKIAGAPAERKKNRKHQQKTARGKDKVREIG